jgi:hypothetical protein
MPRVLIHHALIAAAIVCAALFGIPKQQIASAQEAPAMSRVLYEHAPLALPGQYIVVFKSGVGAADETRAAIDTSVRNRALEQSESAQSIVRRLGGKVGFTYKSALIGFSAELSPTALKALAAAPGIDWIEANQKYALVTVETNPPTGLDRTSERLLPLDNRYTYSETGLGVNVYVIDSGIRATHTDFGGRVSGGADFGGDGHGTDDCFHHGTHVSGTIGGATMGIAKQVSLHPVRVTDCFANLTTATIIAGSDWVATNATLPAVANMSLGGPVSAAMDTAVTGMINAGVTVVVAAGNSSTDACTFSPAHIPAAITVGAIDPTNDSMASFSNFGTCVDLFAPGVNILSDWNTNDTATNLDSGTSMATPHVTGVAARHLQTHPTDTPALVWAAIHAADDIAGANGWPGITGLAAGSPNELLHWGSVNDGFNDGDPHLTTIDGAHFDFQSAGEFVYLKDAGGMQIQTRVTPVSTLSSRLADPNTGLSMCVSLNTAVAAKVGSHRVTFEPNLSGDPDPSGMQLRVDGTLTALSAQGVSLGQGARVVQAATGGSIEIDFPDDTTLTVTPTWWPGPNLWYLNVDVYHTAADSGIMGAVPAGSWIPALADGSSVGPKPAALHQRFVTLYQQFADSWRVSDATSLFDYKPGTATATYTLRSWPTERGACIAPHMTPVRPISALKAREACRRISDEKAAANCIFDARVTGNVKVAKGYQVTERLRTGGTKVVLGSELRGTPERRSAVIVAMVSALASSTKSPPVGSVQFRIGDRVLGNAEADVSGRAELRTYDIKALDQPIRADFTPRKGTQFLPSSATIEPPKFSLQ